MIRNGIKKVNKDLDILKVLKQQKIFAVELWSLLTRSQHQFASKVAEYILSEYSSDEQDGKATQYYAGMLLFDENEVLECKYISDVVEASSDENKRMVEVY